MQTQFGTVIGHTTFGAHFEWLIAAVAKLEFALRAGEMHAAAAEIENLMYFPIDRLPKTLYFKSYRANEYLNLHFGQSIPCICK